MGRWTASWPISPPPGSRAWLWPTSTARTCGRTRRPPTPDRAKAANEAHPRIFVRPARGQRGAWALAGRLWHEARQGLRRCWPPARLRGSPRPGARARSVAPPPRPAPQVAELTDRQSGLRRRRIPRSRPRVGRRPRRALPPRRPRPVALPGVNVQAPQHHRAMLVQAQGAPRGGNKVRQDGCQLRRRRRLARLDQEHGGMNIEMRTGASRRPSLVATGCLPLEEGMAPRRMELGKSRADLPLCPRYHLPASTAFEGASSRRGA